jgi:hypothetical protein
MFAAGCDGWACMRDGGTGILLMRRVCKKCRCTRGGGRQPWQPSRTDACWRSDRSKIASSSTPTDASQPAPSSQRCCSCTHSDNKAAQPTFDPESVCGQIEFPITGRPTGRQQCCLSNVFDWDISMGIRVQSSCRTRGGTMELRPSGGCRQRGA